MGRYNGVLEVAVSEGMLRSMDLLGAAADPRSLLSTNERRRKIVELAVRELISKAEKEVPALRVLAKETKAAEARELARKARERLQKRIDANEARRVRVQAGVPIPKKVKKRLTGLDKQTLAS